MDFRGHYSLSKLTPADYNPRKIKPDAFEKLCESLSKFGVVKPVILNGHNGVLTAGHQRTKALKHIGATEVPAIVLQEISIQDEIKFNLFHNSIETNKTKVFIKGVKELPLGYLFVPADSIEHGENKNAVIVKEICQLIAKYGTWGSIVVNEDGECIQNSDYAVAVKTMKQDLLLYKMPNSQVEEFMSYINRDYGEYNYETLGIKSYNQFHCQMNRLRETENENGVVPMGYSTQAQGI